MTTQAEQLARIEEQNRRIEEMLGRVLGVLCSRMSRCRRSGPLLKAWKA